MSVWVFPWHFQRGKIHTGCFFSLLPFTLWNAWGILRQVQQIIGHDRKHFLNGSDATIVKLSRTSKCGIVFRKSAPPFFHTLLCCFDICCSHQRQRVFFPHYSLLILFLASCLSLFTHVKHKKTSWGNEFMKKGYYHIDCTYNQLSLLNSISAPPVKLKSHSDKG